MSLREFATLVARAAGYRRYRDRKGLSMPTKGPPTLWLTLGSERQEPLMPIAGASEFFRLDVSMTRDVPTIKVVGEVGLAESDDFARSIVEAVGQFQGKRRILDLRELVYIDGKGLTALWDNLDKWRAQGIETAVLAGQGVRQLLTWLQMEQLGTIVHSDDELEKWLDSSQ